MLNPRCISFSRDSKAHRVCTKKNVNGNMSSKQANGGTSRNASTASTTLEATLVIQGGELATSSAYWNLPLGR
ncbi:hypothetical protein ACHQM5_008451 [Ranunculus cassubicifolius]